MFSLDTWTRAKVTHINKRVENHGQELVHAMDINWSVESTNKMLDLIHKSIRATLYRAVGTMPIPGVEESTPELASELIEGPFKLKYEGSGYLLTVKFGEVSGDQIELAGSEIDTFKIDAKQGGSIILHFRSRHSGLTRDMLGILGSIDAKEVSLLAAPPTLQEGTLPKGKRKEPPPPKDTQTSALPLEEQQQPDATAIFAATSAKTVIDKAKGAAKPSAPPAPAKRPPKTFKAKAAIADRKKAAAAAKKKH